MDLHNDGVRVATGEVGLQPIIFVWDSNTLLPLCMIQGHLTIGLSSLHFQPGGDRICASAMDPMHEVAIYEVNTKSVTGVTIIV
jgi:microtubule-associated protein-like 6